MVKKKEKERNVNQSLDANRSNDAKMEVRSGRNYCYRIEKPFPRPFPVPWSMRAKNKLVNLELFPGLQSRMSSNYNVHQKQKQSNSRVQRPFTDVFGPKTKRKLPCLDLLAFDYESLANKAHVAQDAFEEKYGAGAGGTAEANEEKNA